MTLLLVDAANVVGARPDGWWHDRAGATARLLDRLVGLVGLEVPGPHGRVVRCAGVTAVVEGTARDVFGPAGLQLVRAAGSGDDAIVEQAGQNAGKGPLLVVTADRGLRARLPPSTPVTGPGWLLARLDELEGESNSGDIAGGSHGDGG